MKYEGCAFGVSFYFSNYLPHGAFQKTIGPLIMLQPCKILEGDSKVIICRELVASKWHLAFPVEVSKSALALKRFDFGA